MTTHCSAAKPASSSRWSTGSAMVTTEPSMKAIAEARMVAASTQGREAAAQGAAAGAVSAAVTAG